MDCLDCRQRLRLFFFIFISALLLLLNIVFILGMDLRADNSAPGAFLQTLPEQVLAQLSSS